MAFDINEARAIIEEAKLRGLIRPATEPEKQPEANLDHLPDWLQKGIREPNPTSENGSME